MSHKGLQNLWQPDTHFLNAKSSSKSEVVTWIKNIGMVETRTRYAVTTSCPMDLRLFPMDRQMCSLIIQGCPCSIMTRIKLPKPRPIMSLKISSH